MQDGTYVNYVYMSLGSFVFGSYLKFLFKDTHILVPIKRLHTGLSLCSELVTVLPQGVYCHFVSN